MDRYGRKKDILGHFKNIFRRTLGGGDGNGAIKIKWKKTENCHAVKKTSNG